jgi:hypothetical protein
MTAKHSEYLRRPKSADFVHIGFQSPCADPQRGCCPLGHFSWAAIILPYAEQQGLYDQINFNRLAYASKIMKHDGGNAAVM